MYTCNSLELRVPVFTYYIIYSFSNYGDNRIIIFNIIITSILAYIKDAIILVWIIPLLSYILDMVYNIIYIAWNTL